MICLIAASCAPKAIIIEPIAPKAVKVHEQAKAARAAAGKASIATESVHIQAGTIADEVNRAFAEADRLKKLDPNPEKFDPIIAMLDGLKGHSQIHIVSSLEAERRAKESELAQAAVAESSAELIPAATKSDSAVVDMKIKTETNQSDADKWRAFRTTMILMLIAAVVFFMLWLYVKLRPSLI